MRRPLAHFIVLSVAYAVAACAPIRVTTYPERGGDLARHRVYQWAPAAPRATGDPRLDGNPFFDRQVRAAIDHQLLRRGYVEAQLAGMPADFTVQYYASVYQRFQIEEPSPCTGADCRRSVLDFDEGTIVVDAVDAHTARLVWRGVAHDSVQGIVDDQPSMEREIERVISRLLAEFPARLEASD